MQLRIESMLTFEAPFLDLSVTIENIKFNTMLFDKRGIYAFFIFYMPHFQSKTPSNMLSHFNVC